MKIKEAAVGWVHPATATTGQDHLGSIAPCIAVYSSLLPGMTNVTNRARYYSFYPWFLWKYEQTGEPLDPARFDELYRRADCLYTLIAESHSVATRIDPELHASRMVGREKLVPALHELGVHATLNLSTFATQDSNGQRYFKNRLGGLGQYYLGPLEELGILTGRNGHFVQYDPVLGAEIARRFDSGVPGDAFWSTLSQDEVTHATLTDLAAFCPCQLQQNLTEHGWLTDLFWGRLDDTDTSAPSRSQSLALILHLTRAIAPDPNAQIDVPTFRDACYSGSLPNGELWSVPPSLLECRTGWQLYERNELLSVSVQALLTVFVRALELMPYPPRSATDVARFLQQPPQLRGLGNLSWQKFLDDYTAQLPGLANFQQPAHELQIAASLLQDFDGPASSREELSGAVKRVLTLLAILTLRTDFDSLPYGNLPITETFLADYPINLASFQIATTRWQHLTLGEVVEWLLCEWACDTHLRIALRKLRHERLDTFRFHPTDNGLRPNQVPPLAYSNPRVAQAIQILRDIGALKADPDGRFQLTPSGAASLEEVCQS